MQSGLGLKATARIDTGTLLQGRAIWFHEFGDAQQQVTAAFADASGFTAAGPSVGRDTADLGVGLLAFTSIGTTFQIDYDALVRQDFTAHTGTAKVKFEF